MIMLKDNHIDFAGGIENAINKAWDYVQTKKPGLQIEVETRTIEDARALAELELLRPLRSVRIGQVASTARPDFMSPSSIVSQPVETGSTASRSSSSSLSVSACLKA